MIDVNHSHVLQYSTPVWSWVIYFAHDTYFKELHIELRLNYKVGFIIAAEPENESKVEILGWNQSTTKHKTSMKFKNPRFPVSYDMGLQRRASGHL